MASSSKAPVEVKVKLHSESRLVPISFTPAIQTINDEGGLFRCWIRGEPSNNNNNNSSSSSSGSSSSSSDKSLSLSASSPTAISGNISRINRRLNDVLQLTRQIYFLCIDILKTQSYLRMSVFVIDRKWLDTWLDCVLSDELSSGNASEGVPLTGGAPGSSSSMPPINNSHLIEDKVPEGTSTSSSTSTAEAGTDVRSLEIKVKDSLKVDADYYLVCSEVWTALHGWYGGGPTIPTEMTIELKVVDSSIDSNQFAASSPSPEPKIDEVLSKCIIMSNEKLGKLVNGAYIRVGEDSSSSSSKKSSSSPNSSKKSSSYLTRESTPFDGYIWRDCGNEGKTFDDEKALMIDGQSYNKSLCFICHDKAKFQCTACKSFHYCNVDCQKMHWDLGHSKFCKNVKKVPLSCRQFASLYLNKGQEFGIGKRGKMGIKNIGNSCYLSSALQCLLRVTPINFWMLTERYKKQLNLKNKMGTRGELTNAYHDILKNFWLKPGVEFINPTLFKRILGSINPDYGDLSQQDAHDVLQIMLEKMHEDLNKVSSPKPYVEKYEKIITAEDMSQVNNEEIASECWKRHLQREDSVIQDVVGGLVKIQKRCLTCKSRVITFEYQQSVQLAIPSLKTTRKIPFTIIPILSMDQSFNYCSESVSSSSSSGSGNSRIAPPSRPLVITLSINTASKNLGLVDFFENDTLDANKTKGNSKTFDVSSYLSNFSGSFGVNKRQNELSASKNLLQEGFVGLVLPLNSSLPVHVFRDFELFAKEDIPSDKRFVLIDCQACVPQSSAATSFKVYVVQRIFSAGSAEPKLNTFPIFMVLDSNSTIERLRHHIFQQVERTLCQKAGGLWVEYVKKCKSSTVKKAQLEMCHYLNISVIDWGGKPFFPSDVSENSRDNIGFNLPKFKDSNVKFEDFKSSHCKHYSKPFLFLSLNWLQDDLSDSWRIEKKEIDSIFVHSSSNKLLAAAIGGENSSSSISSNRLLPWKVISNSQDLKWDLPFQERLTLDVLLEEYIKTEILCGPNAVFCSAVCKSHQPHERSFKLFKSKLPKTLIVHFKRFEVRDMSGNALYSFLPLSNRRKLDDFVDFPLEGLDVGKYCEEDCSDNNESKASAVGATRGGGGELSSTLEPSSSSSASIESRNSSTLYDLFGVVNHYGRLGFGHYTAHVRDYCKDRVSTNWLEADDHKVSDTSAADVVSKDAYILFYKLRNS